MRRTGIPGIGMVSGLTSGGGAATMGGTPACGLLGTLIAYWPGNEAAGNLLDAHTNGLDLADVNTVTNAAGHVYLLARQYTVASVEYHWRASEALLQLGDIDLTLAAWVYLDSKGAHRSIVSKYFAGPNARTMWLFYNNTTDRFDFHLRLVGDAATAVVTANNLGSPALSTWYFIVAWHDSVANTINIQVDNGVVDSAATGLSLLAAKTSPWNVGAYGGAGGGSSSQWNGRIGPTAFWKSAAGGGGALTQAQRDCLWNAGAGLQYVNFT